jgi:hypothetical protein
MGTIRQALIGISWGCTYRMPPPIVPPIPRSEEALVRRAILALTTMLLAVAVAACGGGSQEAGNPSSAAPTTLPTGSEPVRLDPAKFTAQIDNPYWPMTPGSRWVYREKADGEVQRVEVTVTDQTRTIMGIEARVVHDKVTLENDGRLVEDTYDWYAQDDKGNVWYLGEDTKEYENGKVSSTEGSWEAGVDGAQPGILLPASPQPGLSYRQEYYKGEAEDAAQVLSVDKQAKVPFGAFKDVLQTKDFTPLQPEILEHKYYAQGVGPVLVIGVKGGASREELVRFERTP